MSIDRRKLKSHGGRNHLTEIGGDPRSSHADSGICCGLTALLIVRFRGRSSPGLRTEETLEFQPLCDAAAGQNDLVAALKSALIDSGSVERAYLVEAHVNGRDGVLMLGLRFVADVTDEKSDR